MEYSTFRYADRIEKNPYPWHPEGKTPQKTDSGPMGSVDPKGKL